ncbi:MAG: DUF975 family protein [Thomasclavelia sp.]|uniref:DUF975 family protein n=1 Tax=Thomasclavelia sp. TaxID=3025757 RepID=UPI0039A06A0D
MNIRDIKTKAKSILINRNNIIFVFIFISVTTTIVNYISQTLGVMIPVLSLLISIIMLPFSHGNIVTALKAVNEQGDEITVEHEGLAGLKRFRELFFTYFLQTAFLMVLMLLVCLVLFFIARLTIDESAFNNLGLLFSQAGVYTSDVTAYLEDPAFMQAATSLGGIVILGIIVMAVVAVMYSLIFALTPYVLEKNRIYGVKAMSQSARLMKGHKGTLFVLYLSYLGWYILSIVITSVVQAFLPIPLIIDVLMAALIVYLFSAEMQTSVAVLFEEINLENNV